MVNSNNNNNDNDNVNTDSMSPNELKAYYRGLKRGISLTFVTMNIREATMLNYARYPELRFTRGEPMLVAQDIINDAFVGMKQPIPTPQEISVYDITAQEASVNILRSLMNMGYSADNTTPPGVQKGNSNSNNNNNNTRPPIRKQKIPYDKEKAKKSGAFELSKQQKEELR